MNEQDKHWTGERLETFIHNDNTTEHLHRYAIALEFCHNKTVLDIACGEGYGSRLLANRAAHVWGVDISAETIASASEKYKCNNLAYLTGSCSSIPLESHSVDMVVSFETIEHHDQHEAMMAEIKRVLKPNGLLIISSPDKKYYTDLPSYHNPFHIKELYFEEFKNLMNSNFKNCNFYFQKMVSGSLIMPAALSDKYTGFSGTYTGIQSNTDFEGVYNLCLASDEAVPDAGKSIFSYSEIINRIIADTVERVQNSRSYRLGHFLLAPLRLFRK